MIEFFFKLFLRGVSPVSQSRGGTYGFSLGLMVISITLKVPLRSGTEKGRTRSIGLRSIMIFSSPE